MLGTNMKTETNVKLPISFILFGLIAFIVSQIILFIGSNELLTGLFRIPKIWMSAHFLLLGFAVMTAMGAMYQLIPVAFLTPIWNQKFGFIQFFVTAIGITSFALLLGFKTNYAIYGGSLTVIGIILFIIQMAKTLSKLQTKTTMSNFVISAIICLTLTIIAGLLLVHNLAYGEFFHHVPILMSHITLGIAGWFTLLIFGLSYKLVPMFSLSHGFKTNWEKISYYNYMVGLLFAIVSYWLNIPVIRSIGFLLLFIGFGFFALDMKEIITKRMKKKLDTPFTFSLFAIMNGFIIHFIAFIATILSYDSPTVWGWIIYLYIVSWVLFSILGYLYKIVPFLWWTHKYSEKVGKEKVPMLKDMLNEKLANILYVLLYICLFGTIVSVAFDFAPLLFTFFALQVITSTIYGYSIIRIVFK